MMRKEILVPAEFLSTFIVFAFSSSSQPLPPAPISRQPNHTPLSINPSHDLPWRQRPWGTAPWPRWGSASASPPPSSIGPYE